MPATVSSARSNFFYDFSAIAGNIIKHKPNAGTDFRSLRFLFPTTLDCLLKHDMLKQTVSPERKGLL
jgi:hypothetical protein